MMLQMFQTIEAPLRARADAALSMVAVPSKITLLPFFFKKNRLLKNGA
jgi:hypothetical protein